ncbi:hypothetical protein NERG_00696 [Nematocida ausubeli]|uniref:Uncharacterized protein n=1 Tax=Nematocida ausubeli (strain ATCC PRA-371 / ERTm2) TaxID=1913371 RepID=H8ZAU7_NEMA1|nr:hypothetical protein NERG_00696 [Nematocida ausubeli]
MNKKYFMKIGKGAIERKNSLTRKIAGFIFLVGISIFWLIFLTPLLGSIIFLTGMKRNLSNLKLSKIDITHPDKIEISVNYLLGLPYFSIYAKDIMIGVSTSRNEKPLGYWYISEIEVVNNKNNTVNASMQYVTPKHTSNIDEKFLLNVENQLLFTFKGTVFLKLKKNLPGISIPVVFPYTLGWYIGKNPSITGIKKSGLKLVDTLLKSIESERPPATDTQVGQQTTRGDMPIQIKKYFVEEVENVTKVTARYQYTNIPSCLSANIPSVKLGLYIDNKSVGSLSVEKHTIRRGVIHGGFNRSTAQDSNMPIGKEQTGKNPKKDTRNEEGTQKTKDNPIDTSNTAQFTLTLTPENSQNIRDALGKYMGREAIAFTFSVDEFKKFADPPYTFHYRILKQISTIYINRIIPGQKRDMQIKDTPLFEGRIEGVEKNGLRCKLIFNEELFPYKRMVESINTGRIPSTGLNLFINNECSIVGTGYHYRKESQERDSEYYKNFLVMECILTIPTSMENLSSLFKNNSPDISGLMQNSEVSVKKSSNHCLNTIMSGFGMRWRAGLGISVGYVWLEPLPSTKESVEYSTTYKVLLDLNKQITGINIKSPLEQLVKEPDQALHSYIPSESVNAPSARIEPKERISYDEELEDGVAATCTIECKDRAELENYVRIAWIDTDIVLAQEGVFVTLGMNKSYIDVLASPSSNEWSIRSSVQSVINISVNTDPDAKTPEKISLIEFRDPNGLRTVHRLQPIHLSMKRPNSRLGTRSTILMNIDTFVNDLIKNLHMEGSKSAMNMNGNNAMINTLAVLFRLNKINLPEPKNPKPKRSSVAFLVCIPPTAIALYEHSASQLAGILRADSMEVKFVYCEMGGGSIEVHKSVVNPLKEEKRILIQGVLGEAVFTEGLSLQRKGFSNYFYPFNRSLVGLFKVGMKIALGDGFKENSTVVAGVSNSSDEKAPEVRNIKVAVSGNGADKEYENGLVFRTTAFYGEKALQNPPKNRIAICKDGIVSVSNMYMKITSESNAIVYLKIEFIQMGFVDKLFEFRANLTLCLYNELFDLLLSSDSCLVNMELGSICEESKEHTSKTTLQGMSTLIMINRTIHNYLKKKPTDDIPKNEAFFDIIMRKIRTIFVENNAVHVSVEKHLTRNSKLFDEKQVNSYTNSLISTIEKEKCEYTGRNIHYKNRYIPPCTEKDQPEPILKTRLHKIHITAEQEKTIENMNCLGILIPFSVKTNMIRKALSDSANKQGGLGSYLDMVKNGKKNINLSIEVNNLPIGKIKSTKNEPESSPVLLYIQKASWAYNNEAKPETSRNTMPLDTISVCMSVVAPHYFTLSEYSTKQVELAPIPRLAYNVYMKKEMDKKLPTDQQNNTELRPEPPVGSFYWCFNTAIFLCKKSFSSIKSMLWAEKVENIFNYGIIPDSLLKDNFNGYRAIYIKKTPRFSIDTDEIHAEQKQDKSSTSTAETEIPSGNMFNLASYDYSKNFYLMGTSNHTPTLYIYPALIDIDKSPTKRIAFIMYMHFNRTYSFIMDIFQSKPEKEPEHVSSNLYLVVNNMMLLSIELQPKKESKVGAIGKVVLNCMNSTVSLLRNSIFNYFFIRSNGKMDPSATGILSQSQIEERINEISEQVFKRLYTQDAPSAHISKIFANQ